MQYFPATPCYYLPNPATPLDSVLCAVSGHHSGNDNCPSLSSSFQPKADIDCWLWSRSRRQHSDDLLKPHSHNMQLGVLPRHTEDVIPHPAPFLQPQLQAAKIMSSKLVVLFFLVKIRTTASHPLQEELPASSRDAILLPCSLLCPQPG